MFKKKWFKNGQIGPNGPGAQPFPTPPAGGASDKMKDSYKASAFFTRLRMAQRDPGMARALEDVKGADVVVVDGCYDHAHLVLQLAGIPFVRVAAEQMDRVELRPDQTVFVNCPGNVSPDALRKLSGFVRDGGLLITTDWALKNVVEPAFPGTVAYRSPNTGDEVVRINVLDPNNPVLDGFLEEGVEPLWWLEGSSYPIRVLNHQRVNVLVESKEIAQRYGDAPVIVEFTEGKGRVVHMISHFYLQRSETRDKKDAMSANVMVTANEMAAAPEEVRAAISGLDVGTYVAAQSSVSFISKNIAMQKQKHS